jgi:hypothetical protein
MFEGASVMIFLLIPCYLMSVALVLTIFSLNKRLSPGDRDFHNASAVMDEGSVEGRRTRLPNRGQGATRKAAPPAPLTPKAA